MASSRKSRSSSAADADLAAAVSTRLGGVIKPGDSLLLALSGGIDSVVLLDILTRLHKRRRFMLQALHVNHQLSPNAARWARFCRTACEERGLDCAVVRVDVSRGNSVERAAREARYAALMAVPADFVVLAHTADDQAETVLLQLLRGAGVKGLAAMPFLRKIHEHGASGGSAERKTRPWIIRPLLDVSRADVERYARAHKLAWIEDETNADAAYQRNWLRHEILPLIAMRVPGYRATLARAASHLGEAADLLDELGRGDAADALTTGTIAVAHLRALSNARAKNVLRVWIASRGWPMPQAERLQEALRQALVARSDANVRVELGGCQLRRYRGRVYLTPTHGATSQDTVTWRGEHEVVLRGLGGVLTMTPDCGNGIRVGQLRSDVVTIRARAGGERLHSHPGRPRRSVKNLLQEALLPAWERARLPFIYCGDTLVCIPGVAVDHRYVAAEGEPAISPGWRLM